MKNYVKLLEKVINEGSHHDDRTGVSTVRLFGESLSFDLSDGFPVIQCRKAPWKSAIGEMIGFIKGFNTVEQFESLGCKFWKANAEGWKSTYADGDYLGRIYGIQARDWNGEYDQLANVFEQIRTNPDSRRLLVTHWRPDEFEYMALPPCHVQYQFFVDKDKKEMSLKFDMRSTDLILGAPNNIVGYAFLLWITAKSFGYTPRKLFMTMGDCHIYKDHIEGAKEIVNREIKETLPNIKFIDLFQLPKSGEELKWIETLNPSMFELVGYDPHQQMSFNMAV